MTGGLEGSGEEVDGPVITIQNDWEDALFSSKKEVWVSCKFRGKDSTHSKLRYHGSTNFSSDEFTVTSFKQNSISLKHNDSGFECTFIPPFQTLCSVHSKKIVSLDVTQEFGVSVCSDNKLIVWDAKSGEALRTLSGHIANVYKCKFFPSGVVILSGGSDMQMKIWCAKTGICPVTLIGHRAAVNDFCIVDKGRNIISVSRDGTARLWDCGKAECLGVIFKCSDTLNCCAICEKDGIKTEDRSEDISSREIGTKNKLLIIGSEEGFLYGVAVFTRKVIFTINVNSAVNVLIVSDEKFVAGCQNGKVEIYKFVDEIQKYKTNFESNSPVLCGCIYNVNSFLIGRNDGTVDCLQFDSTSRKSVRLTGPDCDPVYSIGTTRNAIFTACRDSKIRKYVIENAT